MFWKRNKTPAITSRAQDLQLEITDLTSKISQLQTQLGRTAPVSPPTTQLLEPPPQAAPIAIPEMDCTPPRRTVEEFNTAAHYNAQGMRKFDLFGLWLRLREYLGPIGPPNPKFTTYLAVNAVAGLPALRREKKVARNRVIVLALILIIVLWAVLSTVIPQL